MSNLPVSKSLRVLFVGHTYVVGVNQGKLATISNQAEVGLLTPKTWSSQGWNRLLRLEMPYSQLNIFPGRIIFSGRGGAYLFNPFRVWHVIRQFQPDVLQVEEEVFSLCALQLAIFARFMGLPLVIFGWENMDRSLSWPRRWIRDFVLKTASLILAGNREGGQLLEKWNYQGLIDVMPQLGVDEQLFTPDMLTEAGTEINIGFLGRIVYEKGIDLMLEAARQLKQQDLKFKMTICGLGIAQANLEQRAQQLGVDDNIIWKGAVPHGQVPTEMAKFDVLVLPSRSVDTWKEQFGHVLIESMVMGIPTVGSTCGEIPNVINHPDLIFEENNAEELAAILARLVSNKAFRLSMGEYCLQRAQRNYTHTRIAQRLIALWQRILNLPSMPVSPLTLSTSPTLEA